MAQYLAVQAQLDHLESETQTAVNESFALENQQLKAQLQALQQLIQTKDDKIKELSSENNELKLRLTQTNEVVQSTNPIEAQPNQFKPLNQDLESLIETDPLESYFQALNQLYNLSPAQKYDCAMKLFEQGLGPSEVSRILKVNKGTLQHYKDGKRQRPKENEIKNEVPSEKAHE